MIKQSKTIIFFGTDKLSLAVLERLHENGLDIGLIVTKPDNKSGRGHKTTSPLIKNFAIKNNIPTAQPNKLSDIYDNLAEMKKLKPLVGILVSFGRIIPNSIIDLFDNPGIINLHPSLLPKYRGPSPIETAIVNGDKVTGISLMKLTPEMDAGPVFYQQEYEIEPSSTKKQIYDDLAKLGSDAIIANIHKIISGEILPANQDNSEATYTKMLKKSDAWIDFKNISSTQAFNMIRAYQEFPKAKATVLGVEVNITKAHIESHLSSPADIKCADNKFISIEELLPANGRIMTIKEFINWRS